MKNPTKWTPEVQATFLGALAASGLVGKAAKIADVSRETVRMHIQADPAFGRLLDEAQEDYNESLEEEIHRRGFKGYDEEVVLANGKKETRERFSDALATLHAKKRIPAYRDKPIDLNVSGGGVLVVGAPIEDWEEWRKQSNAKDDEDESTASASGDD